MVANDGDEDDAHGIVDRYGQEQVSTLRLVKANSCPSTIFEREATAEIGGRAGSYVDFRIRIKWTESDWSQNLVMSSALGDRTAAVAAPSVYIICFGRH